MNLQNNNMRYKNLVSDKLEKLSNHLITLESLLRQNAPGPKVREWFDNTKEKIEEIQTLVNTERQD